MIIDRMPDARLHYEPSQDVARGPAATQDEEVHAVAGSINRLFVCARNTIRPQSEEIVRRVLHETHGRCVAMTLEGGIILELVQRGTEPAVRPRAIVSRSHSRPVSYLGSHRPCRRQPERRLQTRGRGSGGWNCLRSVETKKQIA